MHPLVVQSPLSGKWMVLTRYKVLDAEKGHIQAQTKYNVTDQMAKILHAEYMRGVRDFKARVRARQALGRKSVL